MSILVDEKTRLLVQGITGRQGTFQTKLMLEYGTNIVAGVTPGRGGESVHSVPVYDDVATAVEKHGANASIIFVPPPGVEEAILEAVEAGLKLIVTITEHVPVHDMLRAKAVAAREGVTVVGPNTPGLISPGKCKVGIMPASIFRKGDVGLVSRSGTLLYEVASTMTRAGCYQSTCIGKGGDPVTGMTVTEYLQLFENDPDTRAVVVLGEIGGSEEEDAAEFIKSNMTKPVVAYIVGRSAPSDKRMGHAGAIVSRGLGSAESKVEAFESAGVPVARRPREIPELISKALASGRK
jgi:succinyl-CoA synthetase alpha subunit